MKNKLTTIGIILVTVLLAGVAIFTAYRLYETRDTAVAPNVPSSEPAAAGSTCGGITGTICPSGETCIYSDGTTRAPYPDATGVCTSEGQAAIACRLNFTISTPTPSPSPSPSPTPTPTKSPSPSPTPSPVPLCNSACTSTSNCPSGMICYITSGNTAGNCRVSACTTASNCVCATATPSPSPTPTKSPSPTPSPTPVVTGTPVVTATPVITASPNPQCNSACTSNSQCMSGMTCYIPSGATAGNCRNTQCLTESDCTCPVAVVTTTPPAEPTLPEVGTSWPTIVGSVFGILVILGSLILAL